MRGDYNMLIHKTYTICVYPPPTFQALKHVTDRDERMVETALRWREFISRDTTAFSLHVYCGGGGGWENAEYSVK